MRSTATPRSPDHARLRCHVCPRCRAPLPNALASDGHARRAATLHAGRARPRCLICRRCCAPSPDALARASMLAASLYSLTGCARPQRPNSPSSLAGQTRPPAPRVRARPPAASRAPRAACARRSLCALPLKLRRRSPDLASVCHASPCLRPCESAAPCARLRLYPRELAALHARPCLRACLPAPRVPTRAAAPLAATGASVVVCRPSRTASRSGVIPIKTLSACPRSLRRPPHALARRLHVLACCRERSPALLVCCPPLLLARLPPDVLFLSSCAVDREREDRECSGGSNG